MSDKLTWESAVARYRAGWWHPYPRAALFAVTAPYTYHATVLEVVDGDTISVDVDFGFYLHHTPTPIRLLGCNAAEHGTPGGDAAKANLAQLLPAGTKVLLSSAKPDKYAPRWDCAVTFLFRGETTDLVQYLISQQWAEAWDGNGPKPVPPWPRTVTP